MDFLRVNMTSLSTCREKIGAKYRLLGNRALVANLVYDEIPPTCNPLGANNKLIFAASPLEGLGITCAGRLSVGCKSPLTGGVKEANGGGLAGSRLTKQALRAIIVEGQPERGKMYILHINKNQSRILPADEYNGMGTYLTTKKLLDKFGEKAAVITIGQAGEQLLLAASVMVSDMEGNASRACGRGGVGAVMGSKGLKAIVIENDGYYKSAVADEKAFQNARQIYHQTILADPGTEGYAKYGTLGVLSPLNSLGALPTRGFRQGRYESADKINADALHDLITARGGSGKTTHACMPGCIIKCSNILAGKDSGQIVSPLEYETTCLFGSNLDIDNIDAIGKLNYLCNDFGIDTIEIGVALGVAADTGLFAFGDVKRVEELLREVAAGTILGKVLGSGAVVTGKVLGNSRVPAVKGQAIAAHEPRSVKSMSVTYAMTPMGADHTAGITSRAMVNHHSAEGAMELSRNAQVGTAFLDSFSCIFVSRSINKNPQTIINLINAVYGTDFTTDYITELGKSVIKLERVFNIAAGVVEEHLPEFMRHEPLEPVGNVSDIPQADYDRFWEESFWGAFPPVRKW